MLINFTSRRTKARSFRISAKRRKSVDLNVYPYFRATSFTSRFLSRRDSLFLFSLSLSLSIDVVIIEFIPRFSNATRTKFLQNEQKYCFAVFNLHLNPRPSCPLERAIATLSGFTRFYAQMPNKSFGNLRLLVHFEYILDDLTEVMLFRANYRTNTSFDRPVINLRDTGV